MSILTNPEIHAINKQIAALKDQVLHTESILPSQRIYSIKKLKVDIESLEAKLTAHEAATAKETAKKAKALEVSLQKVFVMKDKLFYIREELNDGVLELHGSHKQIFFELSKALSQVLLQYKPKDAS